MRKLEAVLLLIAAFELAPAAHADVMTINNGNVLAAQYYLSQTYGEIKDGADNNLQSGGLIRNDSIPIGPSSQTVNLSQSGSSLTSTTSASMDGFARARTAASAQVGNASSTLGYVSVGSYGMRTQVQFDSSQTPGRAVFNFNVTGTTSAPFGTALVRLDFLVDGSPDGSFFDVFGGTALHATGPGSYSFTYVGSTASPLDLMFYASAAVLVGALGFPAAPDGASFTAFADFSNTFDLTGIELYTAADELITDWTLTDLATNTAVFDQNGRIEAAVPEPGSVALIVAGLAGLGLLRRRWTPPS